LAKRGLDYEEASKEIFSKLRFSIILDQEGKERIQPPQLDTKSDEDYKHWKEMCRAWLEVSIMLWWMKSKYRKLDMDSSPCSRLNETISQPTCQRSKEGLRN
jgi:hypothetical protein